MLAMAIIQCNRKVVNILCCKQFTKPSTISQLFVQFPTRSKFENNVNAVFIPKIAVHAQNILVTKVGLNLNLSPQLVFNASFQQLALLDSLYYIIKMWKLKHTVEVITLIATINFVLRSLAK